MGLCHSNGYNRRSSSVNSRTKTGSTNNSLDRDSNSNMTQLNEKRRGKTPNINTTKIKNIENLSEKEFIINKKNINEKFDVISQIDKMSNYSEKIKYDLISENNNNNKKKTKNIETFFNKIIKPNHNNISNIINNNNNNNKKQKPMINIRTKFNNFSKKEIETPIKLKNIDNNNYSTIKAQKSNSHKKEKSKDKEKIIQNKAKIKSDNSNKKNNKNNKIPNTHLSLDILLLKQNNQDNNAINDLYLIKKNQENNNINTNNYSNEETYKKSRKNIKDRLTISNNILNLPERKWYDELIDLNEFLIKYREKFDMKILSIYIMKLLKIYEDFNWLIYSISSYYTNIKYKKLIYNKQNIDLPEINSDKWKQGFIWRGVHVQIFEGEKNKRIINEIKALNYFFFDYVQIIDRYQFIKDNQLSNKIIFPLIGYSYFNGQILLVSALIETDDDIKNKNINKNILEQDKNINLINTMGDKFYVDDLLISKLFYNLNSNNFIHIKKDKYIIINLYKQIPNLFEIDSTPFQKINFFSTIKNKKIFYTLYYDTINKTNIHKEKSKYKTPKDVLHNLYNINISLIKSKDIFINNIHFRILYENELEYFPQEKKAKPKYFINDNFVDNLFNYSYNKKNINKISKIKEPYVIIYDLIEPLKLKYSLINSNKNYVLNGQNVTNENSINNNDIEKKIFFIESNYISHFTSWCKMLSRNSFNIKSYSDLKQNMKKYGINNLLRFFALMLIKNEEINNIIKISFLIKAIKFVFNKETNNLRIKYNEQGMKFFLIKYINSIIYPGEIINKEKEEFNHIYKELIFYSNIFFLKLKLIDNYLNLNLLNLNDIKDFSYGNHFNIKKNNTFFSELNSPEDFLLHIISIARKMPFLFLSELEQKLNFIINPYIKFKSSISIESMKNKLNMEHLILNFTQETFSYIKSDELCGFILAKIITRFNTFEEFNFFNKIGNDKNNNNNEYNTDNNNNFNTNNSNNKTNKEEKTKSPYTLYDRTNNNICNENITNNSDMSKEYIYYDNDILYDIYNKKENSINNINNLDMKKTSKENGTTPQSNLIKDAKKIYSNINLNLNMNNINKKSYQENIKVEWDNIKNDFLFRLPSICYKMPFCNNEFEKKEKFNTLSLYKNLSYVYNIINPKIILEWSELLEKILTQINFSSNGNIEKTLLYSLYFSFLYYFFFDNKEESHIIIYKINKLYSHQEYILSLNDLFIINLFKAISHNVDFIKSEENFSKCLILILLEYGDPRGRYNDAHGVMMYPLWEICYRTVKCENITISENFREMFHALDFFEWNKSLVKYSDINEINNCKNNFEINYENNVSKNLEEIIKIYNIDKDIFKKNENIKEKKLSKIIFDENIIRIKSIKHYNFPKMNDILEKIENSFKSKEFIIFLLKQIQSLFLGNKILYEQNYINEIISPEIFNPEKYINFIKNKNNINTFMNVINLNTNQDKNYFYSHTSTQRNNSAINSHTNTNRSNKNNNYVYNEFSYKNNININIIKNQNNNSKNNNFMDKINISINSNNQRASSKRQNSSQYYNININKFSNIFSHFLYNDLLQKLSFKKNLPSNIIFSFGNNRHSETSHDNLIKITIPRIIFKLKNEYVEKIFSGWEHNIIITKSGEIFSFGNNKNYQCGIPNIFSEKDNKINNPINISKLNSNFKAISASCGNDHTLILKNDNSVYAFGNNEEGELGLKDKSIKTYKFTKINFGNYTHKIKQISAGTVHNLALTFDGKIFTWGSSQGGQLGLSEEFLIKLPGFKESYNIFEPILIPYFNEEIISIGCGEAHSVAVDKMGKVYSWGYGSSGQLGLGFCEDMFEPGISQHKTRIFVPNKITKLEKENIIGVKCGKTFSMFLNEKREIFVCGVNDLNQLGINESNHNNNKICTDIIWPMKLEYLYRQKVIKLSCGEGHCLAIINSQENSRVVWSWGNNKFGQLGHGLGNDPGKRVPKPINYLLGFCEEKKNEENQIIFDDISCGGFHSLCLAKYKESIDWIENDFNIIKNTIRNNKYDNDSEINNNNKIFFSLNNDIDIQSEII